MRIRWDRIAATALLIFCFYLFIKLQPFFKNLFESVNQDYCYVQGPLIIRILMLGLVCLTVVGALKIMFKK